MVIVVGLLLHLDVADIVSDVAPNNLRVGMAGEADAFFAVVVWRCFRDGGAFVVLFCGRGVFVVVFLWWWSGGVFVVVRWWHLFFDSAPFFSAPLSVRMGPFDPQGKDGLAQLALHPLSKREVMDSIPRGGLLVWWCFCGGVVAFLWWWCFCGVFVVVVVVWLCFCGASCNAHSKISTRLERCPRRALGAMHGCRGCPCIWTSVWHRFRRRSKQLLPFWAGMAGGADSWRLITMVSKSPKWNYSPCKWP